MSRQLHITSQGLSISVRHHPGIYSCIVPMKAATIAVTALVFGASQVSAQRAQLSGGVAIVRQLYADFACEAVIDDLNGCGIQHEFVDQPQAVLARYFDDQLVRLWLADLQCAARARAICNLDFSPIWNSQDPVGTVVRNLQVRQPNVHREMHTQMHTLKKTKHCICTEVESSQFSRLNWNPGLPRWMRAANVSRTQPVV